MAGMALVIDMRAHVVGREGNAVVFGRLQREIGVVGIHVHGVEAEMLRLERAVVDGDGAVASSALGLERDTSCQSGEVVIHAEEGAVAQLRYGHRVLIGIPAHERLPVAHIGESVLLFDKDRVGLRHHRVGHE